MLSVADLPPLMGSPIDVCHLEMSPQQALNPPVVSLSLPVPRIDIQSVGSNSRARLGSRAGRRLDRAPDPGAVRAPGDEGERDQLGRVRSLLSLDLGRRGRTGQRWGDGGHRVAMLSIDS